MKHTLLLFMLMAPTIATTQVAAQDNPALAKAFEKFWASHRPRKMKKAARAIVASQAPFDEVYQRLRKGRPYKADVPTGLLMRTRAVDALPHHYAVLVPETYDPKRAYPLHVFLHGGVGRGPYMDRDGSWWFGDFERMKSEDRISLFPAAWVQSSWWHRSQSINIEGLLLELRHTYHIDENRVYLTGISDGATGAYFVASRYGTPWAAYHAYIGHAGVLANREMRIDGDFFPVNLANKPMYVVNTQNDRLYPTAIVDPFIALFKTAGAPITYRPLGGGHDLAWMDRELPKIRKFTSSKVRNPLPDSLVWETETTRRYKRNHWVIIQKLGESDGDPRFPNYNQSQQGPIWPRKGDSGRIGVVRQGNKVIVKASGVRSYSLLLSPDVFDFSQPVAVDVNGKLVFEEQVTPDVTTLLRWFQADQDRTMLFGAQLDFTIP